MIIFLRPGEQVEVHFIAEGSTQQISSMKTFKEVVVVKHDTDSHGKAGTIDDKGLFVDAFEIPLATNNQDRGKNHEST